MPKTPEQEHADNVEWRRQKLEDAALNYARMKTQGFYLEDGMKYIVHGTELRDMTEMFLGNLKRAAENLLNELSSAPLPPRANS